MKKRYVYQVVVTLILFVAIFFSGCNSSGPEGRLPWDEVDPDIGGVGWLLQPTRPTVSVPNSMVRMYPVRPDWLSDQISFFPLTIKSHRQGELFGIMPYAGKAEDRSWTRKEMYDHDLEITRPWYFATYFLDSDIETEYTAGRHSGFFRFNYEEQQDRLRVIRLQVNNRGIWRQVAPQAVEGVEEFDGMKAFVYGEFNVKGRSVQDTLTVTDPRRKTVRHLPVLLFNIDKGSDNTVMFRYGVSFISAEQAKKNLEEEIPGWEFMRLADATKEVWKEKLGQIRVKGGTPEQRRVFYTALYRCYERMVDITEDSLYYSAYDHQVHKADHPFYADDWIWDTYLALHPLRMILDPASETDMIRSYVDMYVQSGWLPQFPLIYEDYAAMNGFHSTIMILDAWRKGLRDFDAEKAYEGMKKNALQATLLPWRNGPATVLDTFYRQHGYFPALHPGEKETVPRVHPFERRQAVAVTLGASYDDWALAEMAKELGKEDDFKYFIGQALNYRNLYKADRKLFMPKDAAGNWIDIDPGWDGGPGGRDYYDENNGYTYAWQAQHDINGLIRLKGGREAFTRELDELFRMSLGRTKYQYFSKFPDGTGMVGQFSMGNEPSFHIPYLYNYSGAPWKTQKHIRFLLDAWFPDYIFGIPGDEDGGGMSAFVVFSMMGFYPVTPGLPVYNIGSPVFKEVTIRLPGGKKFRVVAENYAPENKYIQSAKLNGKPLNKPWFTHEELMAGGTLKLTMGAYPNKAWGSREKEAPPASENLKSKRSKSRKGQKVMNY